MTAKEDIEGMLKLAMVDYKTMCKKLEGMQERMGALRLRIEDQEALLAFLKEESATGGKLSAVRK